MQYDYFYCRKILILSLFTHLPDPRDYVNYRLPDFLRILLISDVDLSDASMCDGNFIRAAAFWVNLQLASQL